MKPKYLPVDHDYFEIFDREMEKEEARVIYFAFSDEPELEELRGKIMKIREIKDEGGYYLFFENGDRVRLDRIVVINGIPGPAYDEYDSYALAPPLTCQAGYDNCNW